MSLRSVIVVAGGSGTRMRSEIPKQFLLLRQKPIIIHSLLAFLNFDPDIELIAVLPAAYIAQFRQIRQDFLPNHSIKIVAGGATRFQSVANGLSEVTGSLVAIHDAVRPLVSPEVIGASFKSAELKGSGVVMVKLKDSIRQQDEAGSTALDRARYLLVQTPQTFEVKKIRTAFEQKESTLFTDDASVFEAAGFPIAIVEGDYSNIKITTPEDMLVAEALMNA